MGADLPKVVMPIWWWEYRSQPVTERHSTLSTLPIRPAARVARARTPPDDRHTGGQDRSTVVDGLAIKEFGTWHGYHADLIKGREPPQSRHQYHLYLQGSQQLGSIDTERSLGPSAYQDLPRTTLSGSRQPTARKHTKSGSLASVSWRM